jgi:hypothetical protein
MGRDVPMIAFSVSQSCQGAHEDRYDSARALNRVRVDSMSNLIDGMVTIPRLSSPLKSRLSHCRYRPLAESSCFAIKSLPVRIVNVAKNISFIKTRLYGRLSTISCRCSVPAVSGAIYLGTFRREVRRMVSWNAGTTAERWGKSIIRATRKPSHHLSTLISDVLRVSVPSEHAGWRDEAAQDSPATWPPHTLS